MAFRVLLVCLAVSYVAATVLEDKESIVIESSDDDYQASLVNQTSNDDEISSSEGSGELSVDDDAGIARKKRPGWRPRPTVRPRPTSRPKPPSGDHRPGKPDKPWHHRPSVKLPRKVVEYVAKRALSTLTDTIVQEGYEAVKSWIQGRGIESNACLDGSLDYCMNAVNERDTASLGKCVLSFTDQQCDTE